MNVIVVGGGAAGCMAAGAAARQGHRVTVVERGRRTLKKLGVTGNGRGNLLNAGQPQYHGDEAFALEVLRHMPYEPIAAFLESCGIPLVHGVIDGFPVQFFHVHFWIAVASLMLIISSPSASPII